MAYANKRGNSYQIIATDGYDTSGKQIRKTMTWRPSPDMTAKQIEKELERVRIHFQEQVERGGAMVADKQMTLDEYWKIWLIEHAERTLEPKTVLDYKKLWIRIEPALGHIRLFKLTQEHLNAFYRQLRVTPNQKKAGETLSGYTQIRYHRLLSSILGTAVEDGLLDSNPAQKAKAPKVVTKEVEALTKEQAKKLFAALDNEPSQFRAMIGLLLFTGMRKGELFGLKWSDFNPNSGMLSIARALQYLPKRGIIEKLPKTKSGIRALKLPSSAIELLKDYRAEQNTHIAKVGDYYVDSGYMFTRDDGKPCHPDSLPKQFKKFLAKNDLPKSAHLHTLRHTMITLLIQKGTAPYAVSKVAGHKTYRTTLEKYTHWFTEQEIAAQEALDILS